MRRKILALSLAVFMVFGVALPMIEVHAASPEPLFDAFEREALGADWNVTTNNGTWGIADDPIDINTPKNKTLYVNSTGSAGAIANVGDASWTDYTVQADVLFANSSNGYPGIVARYSSNNFYMFRINYNNKSFELYTFYGSSSNAVLASKTFSAAGVTVSNNKWYTLKMELSGNNIKCYFAPKDEAEMEIFDYTDADSRHSAGKVGFRSSMTAFHADNLLVTFPGGPPVVPTPTLSVFNVTQDSVSLSWNAIALAEKYKIYRSENEDDGYSVIHTTSDKSTTTYTDTGLTKETTYFYKIVAIGDADNESAMSPAVSARPDIPYTITFDSNGGSDVAPLIVTKGYYAQPPSEPTRTDYGFCGWYLDYQFENAFDFENTQLTEDITLYAKWAHRGNSINRTSGIKTINPLTTLNSYTRIPNWFNALDTAADKTVKSDNITTGPIVVIVEFQEENTLSCIDIDHRGGGNNNIAAENYTISGANEELAWDDAGWTTIIDVVGNTDIIRRFPIESYARYKYIKVQIHSTNGQWRGFRAVEFFGRPDFNFNVNFDTGEGVDPIDPIVSDYGKKISAPDLDEPGLTLIGWFMDEGLTKPWDFNKNIVTGDITLYASWESQVPLASDLVIEGAGFIGNTLTGSYATFSAQDGHNETGSTAFWRRADDAEFKINVVTVKAAEPISQGATSSYTLTGADDGKYIQFVVIPRSDGAEHNVGREAKISLPNAVRVAITQPVVKLTAPYKGFRIHEGTPISLSAVATVENTSVTKIEYYANNEKIAESSTSPFDTVWTNPTPGEYEIFAKAYNSIPETGDSPAVSIKVYAHDEPIEPVWTKKWSYDFNAFTQSDVYGNSNKLTDGFPNGGPDISYNTGGTFQSANGKFGKSADDYHFQSNSISGGQNRTGLVFPLDGLDQPIKTLVAEVDIAFSATDEHNYVLAYTLPGDRRYNTFYFNQYSKIRYFTGSGSSNSPFLDKDGNELTYEPETWYRVGVKLDFENKTITYYLNGEEILTRDAPEPDRFTFPTNLRITGNHTGSQAGITYIDNMFLGQLQDSQVNAVITSPVSGYTRYWYTGYKYPVSYHLTGSNIAFSGYAKDGRDVPIQKTELLLNGESIQETQGATFDFTRSNIPPGHHILQVKATSEDGMVGYSDEVPIIVSAITIPAKYGNNMLLQRNKDIKLEGSGKNGETVTVKLNGIEKTSAITNNKWAVVLPPQPANKKTTLEFVTSDGVTIAFDNVAIGELLMTYGQSNMRYEIEKYQYTYIYEADKEYEDIRLFNPIFGSPSAGAEQTDVSGMWTTATPIHSLLYSAVGFLTAKDFYLANNGEIPIGMVNASEGGASINSFAPTGAYQYDPDLTDASSTIYKNLIAPWKNYTFGTFYYYQGEAQTQLNTPYEKLLTQKIDALREAFNDPALNFIIVQLPAYDYPRYYANNPNRSAIGVRDAQWNVAERIEGVETTVGADIGNVNDLHPDDKLPIAKRASLILQHFSNPNDTELNWRSPSYSHHEVNSGIMTIYFKDIADGLRTKDYDSTEVDAVNQAPRGFTLADNYGVFQPVDAVIVGDTVQIDVSSVTVGEPKVRYAFTDTPPNRVFGSITRPDLNLVNSAKLPVAPFRTDSDKYNLNSTAEFYVNYAPAIRWIKADYLIDDKCKLIINARDYDGTITKLEVFKDNTSLGYATQVPGSEDTFEFLWEGATKGTFSFHAIATDNEETTSIMMHSSMGTTTSNARRFALTIEESLFVIYPFKDLDGNIIESFGGENGVSVRADLKETNGIFVLAAYDGDMLLNIVLSYDGEGASFTAEELANATSVRAYVWEDFDNIEPLGDFKSLDR